MKTSQQVEDEKMLDSSTIPDLNPFVEEASIFSPTGHLFRLAMFSSPSKYREFVEIVMDDIDQIDQEYIRSQLQCDDLKISKTSRQTALLHFPSPESGNSILRHFWRDFDSPRSRISELRNKILGVNNIYLCFFGKSFFI
ncbi:MAG: hypothetical protein MHMPM18_004667 [Marteilia pararefringens]